MSAPLMAPDRDDPSIVPSEHFDAFRLRVGRLRHRPLNNEHVLDLIEDLGGQVSTLRHHQVQMIQGDKLRDIRLFGDSDLGIIGAFDQVRLSVSAVADLVRSNGEQDRLDRREAVHEAHTDTREAARTARHEKGARTRWWQQWWGIAGIGCGILFGAAQLGLAIYAAVQPR